ncbi:acyl-CoA thioesterase [Azospirillum doebereinerae]
MISATVAIQAQFYHLDPMQVVWHGNYAQFLEQARCALLERIGYSYPEMAASGYMWPIVDMRLKYVRPVRLAQTILVEATLVEYENRIKVDYRIRDEKTGELLNKAHTVQLAVSVETGELSFDSPAVLIEKVRALL